MIPGTLRPRTLLARLAPGLVLVLAACGGSTIGAVVAGDGVEVRTADGVVATPGPTPFGNGGILAAGSAAKVRVTAGGMLSEGSKADGDPGAGLLDVHLEPGAQLRRREGAAFDLLDGTVRLHAGPLRSRLVVFHGAAFLEVRADESPDGFDVRATAEGDTLTIEVKRGNVILNSTGATQKDLLFVKLMAGEAASATPGSEPVKRK